MQPKIIKKDKLYIKGLTGNGAKTGEVWNDLDSRYNKNPFPKADDNGYEIRFWSKEKSGKDVHVGFLTESEHEAGEFTTIAIPPTEYAVFDVYVAKGYDSGNAEMDKWLEDNSLRLKCRDIDGNGFIMEHYNEKFKDGNKPDSIVEFWVPFYRFCQSCFMPITTADKYGTEADGSQNLDYCCHCYGNGDFVWGADFNEFVEENISFWRDGCKNDDEARARIMEVFPKLKRWAK